MEQILRSVLSRLCQLHKVLARFTVRMNVAHHILIVIHTKHETVRAGGTLELDCQVATAAAKVNDPLSLAGLQPLQNWHCVLVRVYERRYPVVVVR